MKVLALLCLATVALAKHEQYIGWKSYYLGPTTFEQLQAIGRLHDEFDLDILSHPILEREGITLVKPEHHVAFIKAIEDEGIPYRIHRDDVKAALDYDDMVIEKRRSERAARNSREMPYDSYQRIAVIDEYLQDVASRYPDIVTLVTPANTFNGHPIQYLKISTTNFEDESKPVIFIDGGIHAREWISPPTVTYAIRKLVEDVTESDLLDKFDWILLPVVNPDGYEHTFTSFRFWRKTRSTDQHQLSPACPGVDGNRNYDFFWNTVGTNPSPCSDTYAGSRAFSEIETRVVRDIVNENLHRIALYLTMHSYGSMILYPWGHDGTLSPNAFALHVVGIAMADKIHESQLPNFPSYAVGNSLLVIGYGAAGAAEDWAHLVGVPLSYTYELPGLDGGFNGFHLDPIYIEQVVKDTWEGIVVGAREAGELFLRKKSL
ncbi:carboxypeptidase B-like [Plodia interpunctella]|uniref:carboxypeptidase B-like n=1 Tax=Plodia interpunctella TaxID=58824 RepID=UPI0023684A6F|nr:carboxypeptidase B-like [Plodia interpunctella]